MGVFWSLPNEFRPMSAAIDSGNPVVLDSPRSRLARSYHDLASALADAATENAVVGTVQNGNSREAKTG
jgi:MinD-like ATPase involved in chromosome partitioning or flagellar assembly